MPRTPYILNGVKLPGVSDIVYADTQKNIYRRDGNLRKAVKDKFERGTLIHEMIYKFLKQFDIDSFPEQIKEFQGSIVKFASDFLSLSDCEILAQEQAFLVNTPNLAFAGTPDLVVRINGINILIDFKSFHGIWSREKDDNDVIRASFSPFYPIARKPLEGECDANFSIEDIPWDWVYLYLKKAFMQCGFYKLAAEYNKLPIDEIWVIVILKGLPDYQIIKLPSRLWQDCHNNMMELYQLYLQNQKKLINV